MRREADGSYWRYEYDSLGQVISGKKYWSDGTPVPGQQFEYAFDDIGNRTGTKAGGDANGTNLRNADYSGNLERRCERSNDWPRPSGHSTLKMKTPLRVLSALVTSLFVMTGCQTQEQPRVLRVALNPDRSTWRLSVNGAERGDAFSSSKLTNEVARLRPRWGDVLLLSSPAAVESDQVEVAEEWLFRCCQSNRVAVNLTYGYTGVDMFSVSAYHWTAPFDYPFDLAKASFFHEGRLVGSGTNGFEALLRQIASDRPKQVFILGSMYDTGRSFPPNASPYEKQRDWLYSVLRTAGTDFIELDPLP